jgi:NCS1 family nucleobase:cation symporter-1
MSKAGTYWYKHGYNPKAVAATVVSAAVAVFPVLFGHLPGMTTTAQYSWFIGCALAFALYWAVMRNSPAPGPRIGAQETVAAG